MTLADQIAANLIEKLYAIDALTVDDRSFVTRVSNRLAFAATAALTDPSLTAALKMQTDLDLAALENLACAKEINAAALARQATVDVVTLAVQAAIGVVLPPRLSPHEGK